MTASRARKKIRHDENTRAKIQAAHIIRRFQDCLDGKVELTPTQVTCGKTLLAKILPDLQAMQVSGDAENPLVIVGKEQRDAAVKAATRADA
jgi:hypothetical protein